MSRYRRFFSPVNHLTESQLDYLTLVDHHDHEAIVALASGEIRGVARYVRPEPDSPRAEVAVVVEDSWQGRGLGTELLDHVGAAPERTACRPARPRRCLRTRRSSTCWAGFGPTASRRAGAGEVELEIELDGEDLNLLGYIPNGKEGPDNAARQEGYLFWLAWLNHSATQLFSSSDAHGTLRPVTIAAPCATIAQVLEAQPELEFTSVLTPLLTDSKACNGGDSGGTLPDLPELPDRPRPRRRSEAAADADLGALLLARHGDGRLRPLVLSGCCCSCGCPSAARSR